VLLLVSGAGLLGGNTGGKLVYQYGAASAYTPVEAGSGEAARRSGAGHDRRVAQGKGRNAGDDD
jgi:hypothetical protein